MKEKTNLQRYQERLENYNMGAKLYKEGKIKESIKYFQKSIFVSPQLANHVQQRLKESYEDQIKFILAPYEADAQLAYLCKKNLVDFVITEDSDLFVFGTKVCLNKLNRNMDGMELRLEDIMKNQYYDLEKFGPQKFIEICILTGCDYLPSPERVGFKTAVKLFKKHHTIESIIQNSKK